MTTMTARQLAQFCFDQDTAAFGGPLKQNGRIAYDGWLRSAEANWDTGMVAALRAVSRAAFADVWEELVATAEAR